MNYVLVEEKNGKRSPPFSSALSQKQVLWYFYMVDFRTGFAPKGIEEESPYLPIQDVLAVMCAEWPSRFSLSESDKDALPVLIKKGGIREVKKELVSAWADSEIGGADLFYRIIDARKRKIDPTKHPEHFALHTKILEALHHRDSSFEWEAFNYYGAVAFDDFFDDVCCIDEEAPHKVAQQGKRC